MANSKQWYSTVDVALPSTDTAAHTNASVAWLFKQLLIGNGVGTNGPEGAAPGSAFWTVDSCCDGSTTNTLGTDLWLTSFDATKLVWANAGSAHSWMVLKSPTGLGQGGPYYLTLDLSSSVSQNMVVSLSRGTRPTGGTTTAAPTASGSIVLSAAAFTDNTIPGSGGRCHRTIDANGNFWLLYGKSGSSALSTCLMVNQLTNLRASGDAYDVMVSLEGNQTQCSKLGQMLVAVASATQNKCLTYQGTVVSCCVPTIHLGSGNDALTSGITTSSHGADGLWDTIQAQVFITGASVNNQWKGDLPDVFIASAAIVTGTKEPATGTQEKLMVGNLFLPFTLIPSL